MTETNFIVAGGGGGVQLGIAACFFEGRNKFTARLKVENHVVRFELLKSDPFQRTFNCPLVLNCLLFKKVSDGATQITQNSNPSTKVLHKPVENSKLLVQMLEL